MPPIKYCKICFKKIKNDDIYRLFDGKYCLCNTCQDEMEPLFVRFKVDGYKACTIYDYSPFIKNLIYLYKGCYDYELNEVFLNPFFQEIKLRYKGYKMIPIPSYEEDNQKRGFNHVLEAFKNIDVEVLPIIEKTAHHKQAELSSKDRSEIKKYLVLKERPDLSKTKVLLVDDIYTTGSTMKAAINLVEKLNPKTIRILVLAKTRAKTDSKTNTNIF